MRFFDFSSWQSILTSVLGILLFTLIAMGIRVLMMLTIQQRQQRMNRQINERLRTLIAAYKVLGGSFTGRLTVDPSHLGRSRAAPADSADPTAVLTLEPLTSDGATEPGHSLSAFAIERRVQIRDAVEAALSDILLLGTEEQVRLAGKAAADMAAGRPIHTAELVSVLRNYIRKALDLERIPEDLEIPAQGPTRPPAGGGRGARGSAQGSERGGAGGGGGGTGASGMGMGLGMGMGRRSDEG